MFLTLNERLYEDSIMTSVILSRISQQKMTGCFYVVTIMFVQPDPAVAVTVTGPISTITAYNHETFFDIIYFFIFPMT